MNLELFGKKNLPKKGLVFCLDPLINLEKVIESKGMIKMLQLNKICLLFIFILQRCNTKSSNANFIHCCNGKTTFN